MRIWILAAFSVVLGCGLLSDLTGTRCNSDGFCGDGLVCLEGRCESSCGALTDCGGYCVDLQQDPKNCGICQSACSEDWTCFAGACVPGEAPDGVDAGSEDGGSGTPDGGNGDGGSGPVVDVGGERPFCDHAGWCWERPTRPSADLTAVHHFGPDHVWAVGEMGLAMRWNGHYWTGHPIPSDRVRMRAIHGSDENAVWAVGDDSVIAAWNGSKWMTEPGRKDGEPLYAVWAISPNHVIAVGQNPEVFLRWNGESWEEADIDSSGALFALWGDGTGSVYAVGAGGAVLRYAYDPEFPDDAARGAWEEVAEALPGAPDLFAVTGDESRLIVGGAQGKLFVRIGDGEFEAWDSLVAGDDVRALDVDEHGTLWVGLESGKVHRFDPAGSELGSALVHHSPEVKLAALRAFGSERAIAVGTHGLISWWERDGGAGIWREEVPGDASEVRAIVVGGERAWALAEPGESGDFLVRDAETGTWGPGPVAPFRVNAIGTDPKGTDVWLVGVNGIGFALKDAESLSFATYDLQTADPPVFAAVSSPSPAMAFVAGRAGKGLLLKCTVTDPVLPSVECTRMEIEEPAPDALLTVWAVSENDVWVGGEGDALLRCDATRCRHVQNPQASNWTYHAIWAPNSVDSAWLVATQPQGANIVWHWGSQSFWTIKGFDNPSEYLTAVSGLPDGSNEAWFVGRSGRWGRLTQTQIEDEAPPVGFDLMGIAVTESSTWVAGMRGTILRRDH